MEELPRPIPPHDAHVHTVYSDGVGTVRDMVRAAEASGLDAVAITDHADAHTTDLDERMRAVEAAAARSSVAVATGVELTILDYHGRLSIPGGLGRAQVVLVGLGMETRGIATEVPADRARLMEHVFEAYRAAVDSGHANVLAHPFNLGRFPAPLTPEELPRAWLRDLARLMVDREVMLELSATAWWWHPDLSVSEFVRQWAEVLRVFAAEDVRFIAGTNAHSPQAVGNNHFTRRLMRLAGIELSQVVNLRALAQRARRP